MSKIFRTVVASSIIGGVALVSPLTAEAKAVTALPLAPAVITLDSCAGGTGATGSVTTSSFSITVPGIPVGAAYEYRARVFTVVNGKQVFSTKRVRVPSTLPTDGGALPAGALAYRLDVVDTNAEAAGLPALVFTSDGIAGCD
jgi:hypothetical protein